jgi:mRNA-degrading endonuclease RelE of RelBE toxin-antitoxin system
MPGPYTLVITKRAHAHLDGLPTGDRDRMVRRLEAYAADPENPRHDVRLIIGQEKWRLRSGDWRAIFEINGQRVEF